MTPGTSGVNVTKLIYMYYVNLWIKVILLKINKEIYKKKKKTHSQKISV